MLNFNLPKLDPIVARDALAILAAASIAFGAGMIYLPAGFIVGGVLVLAGAVLSARNDQAEKTS